MKTRLLAIGLLSLSWLAASAPAQSFITLPDGSWANDVTPDGEIVVGTHFNGGFIWRWRVDPQPTVIPGGDVIAVSDDGSVLLGNTIDPITGGQIAALWTAAGGWEPLPGVSSCGSVSSAYGLSGDGKSATGFAWANGCDARAFLWTESGGLELLDSLGNGTNRASAISQDGQVIAGFAQGIFARSPAVWSTDGSGWIYDIDDVGDDIGEVYGLNNDGSTILGAWNGDAFRDEDGVVTIMGSLNGGNWTGIPTDISEDGNTIVGFDTLGLGREAWMWTPADGIVALDTIIARAGFPNANETWVCRAMSDDGNVIVGGAQQTGGPWGFGAFIFERNSLEVWADLGNALAGTHGDLVLEGFGSLTAGSSASLTLTNGIASGTAYLVVGLSQLDAAFKGGVLVPALDIVNGPLPLNAAGALSISTHWPAGIPSGFSTYFQYWAPDGAAPVGFAASNAVSGTTP